MLWRHVASWRHTMTSHNIITAHNRPLFCILALKLENSGNCHFWPGDLDLWPMTLTIELIQDIIKVNPCTKFCVDMSNGSVVRVPTHRHTHRRDSFYNLSTADAGGNNFVCGLFHVWEFFLLHLLLHMWNDYAWAFTHLPRRTFAGPLAPKLVIWHHLTSHLCHHIIGHVTQIVKRCTFRPSQPPWLTVWLGLIVLGGH